MCLVFVNKETFSVLIVMHPLEQCKVGNSWVAGVVFLNSIALGPGTHTALVLKKSSPKTKTSIRKLVSSKTVAEMLVDRHMRRNWNYKASVWDEYLDFNLYSLLPAADRLKDRLSIETFRKAGSKTMTCLSFHCGFRHFQEASLIVRKLSEVSEINGGDTGVKVRKKMHTWVKMVAHGISHIIDETCETDLKCSAIWRATVYRRKQPKCSFRRRTELKETTEGNNWTWRNTDWTGACFRNFLPIHQKWQPFWNHWRKPYDTEEPCCQMDE